MMNRRTLALALPAFAAACASLPARRIYVLGHGGGSEPATRQDAGRPVLEIRPVLVPDYLDTRDILLRAGANEVAASTTGQWGERLSLGITRALAEALATRLPDIVVVTNPQGASPRWQLLVDVAAVALAADGQCRLDVRWTLLEGERRRVAASQSASLATRAAPPGDAGAAASLTAAIDALAGRIAAATGRAAP